MIRFVRPLVHKFIHSFVCCVPVKNCLTPVSQLLILDVIMSWEINISLMKKLLYTNKYVTWYIDTENNTYWTFCWNQNNQTDGKSCECPSLIYDVFFQPKIFDNFENAKTYEDHVRFAQDFRWIRIMIHSISDSNIIQIGWIFWP